MEKTKDERQTVIPSRAAQWSCTAALVWLAVHTVAFAQYVPGPPRHFDLEPGDATVMLNEYSRQSDLQVLFDFSVLKGMQTHSVNGEFEPKDALDELLKGTILTYEFVNDRTLAVTPKRNLFSRLWHRRKAPAKRADGDGMEQVLVSRAGESGTEPLLGAQTLEFNRTDIERTGLATTQDFLRTLPQVFGGGPTQDTVLGREAITNSARGSGVNLRGLDAGSTLVLIDGRRIAPSGTAGSFEDISNIPLSIVERIDVLPDGASAQYGADAVGGVINFITRSNLSGLHTQARGGGVTDGHMGERQFSQFFGNTRDSGSDLLSFEYFKRDPLRAQDRWQETSDLTPFGGDNFNLMYGSPGTITDGSQFWPIPKGQNGKELSAASLAPGAPNLYDQDQGVYITPREERWSVFGRDTLKLSDSFGLYAEGLVTRRKIQSIQGASEALILSVPESNPFYVNPTGVSGPVTVLAGTSAFFGPLLAENRIDSGNFALSFNASSGRGWSTTGGVAYTFEKQHAVQHGLFDQTALDKALADSNRATAFNPFGDGANTDPATLASIRADGFYHSVSSLKTANLSTRGPTVPLPGGDVEATVGTEYRIQSIETTAILPGTGTSNSGNLSRDVLAAFSEIRVPIIGEHNELTLAKRLDLTLGVRHERFTDIGSATIPKLGMRWLASSSLTIRGTWTKSFRPPNLTDMVAKNSLSKILPFTDPSASNGFTEALVLYGTNPNLQPEKAHTWTIGTDFAPNFVPGSMFSLTYFNTSYSGRIDEQVLTRSVLALPGMAWLVNRNFSQSQLEDACAQATYQGPAGSCTSSQIGAIIDNRLRNVALLKTSGIDLIGKYSLSNHLGRFDFGLNGTYLLRYAQANTPGSPLLNIVSTQNNPIDLRVRGLAGWTYSHFGVSTFVNFQDSYRDTLSVPNRGVSPWTTVDLQLSYQTAEDASGPLGQVQFAFNVQNAFNVNPPFLNNPLGVGYDQENADLYGRLVSFEIRKRW